MRRSLIVTGAFGAGLLLLTVPHGRGPSVEQLFVAQTHAAAESDNVCVMGEDGDPAGQAQAAQEQNPAAAQAARLAVPKGTDTTSDLPPLRMVVDPYPSFN